MDIKRPIHRLLDGLPHRVKIGRRYIGPDEPTFVIAEVGINHNGDPALARQLIDAAVAAGADAVKFQKRTTEDILTKEGLEKPYLSPHAFAPTYGEHRRKLEFSEAQYRELKQYADSRGILFFASVWDQKSADAMEALTVAAYKIPSADLINIPLVEYVAMKNYPVLLSTGMNTFEEVEDAVHAVLRHNERLVIFHCLSLYPSPEEKINLRAMDTLRKRFSPLPIGYSGHEKDLLPTIAAVARGACIVERHLTLDKTMRGSDHAASLEPHEFSELVRSIHRIEHILGSSEKPLYDELHALRVKLAKSVVTKVAIPEGTVIREEMLAIKGPGTGLKPSQLRALVGRSTRVSLAADTVVPKEALTW